MISLNHFSKCPSVLKQPSRPNGSMPFCVDTRRYKHPSVFVAIPGVKVNPLDIINPLLDQGCPVVVYQKNPENEEKARVLSAKYKSTEFIPVTDSVTFLQEYSHHHINEWKAKDPKNTVFAISGSNGKTTHKEMLSHIKETDQDVPYGKGGYFYYSRTEEGKQYKIYCRKKGSLDAAEEVVLDLNTLAGNAGLDINNVRYVRIVDVVGDGNAFDDYPAAFGGPQRIYDPYPQVGSAGFDLDAIGVLHIAAAPVPEPAQFSMLIAGLLLMLGVGRRRKNSSDR